MDRLFLLLWIFLLRCKDASALERAGDTYSLPSAGTDPVFTGPNARYVVTSEAASARCAVPADFDLDGDLDVVSVSSADNTIAWYERRGDGSYGPKQMISGASNGARIVTIGDIDQDNKTDVIVASYYDHTVGWFRNLGGSFGPMYVITRAAIAAQGVSVADLDNDGDLDVLVASSGDSIISWFENLGDGKFCEIKNVVDTQALGVRTVIAADLDDDGFLDLAAASKDDHTIAWYRNDGKLNFEKIIIDDAATGAYSLVAKDVDRDGCIDLVTAANMDGKIEQNGEGGLVSFYRNYFNHSLSRLGSFQKIAVTAGNSTGLNDFDWFVLSVWAGDLDGDGDIDIASASYSLLHEGGISWYENIDGSGDTWSRHRLYTSPSSHTGHYVFGADMDGDGDVDLLAVTNADNKVHILYANTSCDTSSNRSEACCRGTNQYWSGSSCVSCRQGFYVHRTPDGAQMCKQCRTSCVRPGLAFRPAACHSTRTSCAREEMESAIARCDCGKDHYLDEYFTCASCPAGHVTADGSTRSLADHVLSTESLQDGTKFMISDLSWSGFNPQRCELDQVSYVIWVLWIGGSLILAVIIVVTSFCCIRKYYRIINEDPTNPAYNVGYWVLQCTGPFIQGHLKRNPHGRKSWVRRLVVESRWVVNASPFEIEVCFGGMKPSSFVLQPYSSALRFRSCKKCRIDLQVRSLPGDDMWHSMSEELQTSVEVTEWSHFASELDRDSPKAVRYTFCSVRKRLPDTAAGGSMGELKLQMLRRGSLLFTWSPPHVNRGVPMNQFIDFLQEVVDHPKVWHKCLDFSEDGSSEVMDKPPGCVKRNMYDACTHIVVPQSAQFDSSYAEMFTDYGPATLFVSHVWAEYATETLAAMTKLKQWMGKQSCTFSNTVTSNGTNIWFCTLCNNQSRVIEELGSDVHFSPFAQVIKSPSCPHVAMVSPFRALARKWCNYEFCLARSQDKSVAMLTADGVVQAGHVPPKHLVALSEKVMKLQSRNATCTSSSDSLFIDNAIQLMGGYEATDNIVRSLFYNVISEAYDYLGKSLSNMADHSADATAMGHLYHFVSTDVVDKNDKLLHI
eukprot:TRINITY_DN25011_c0_g1_i1.p1 TRINITY_DN25011_c0_g1~~TRINITY_DN25011_c0_g1_i1.p1  ORF type:complete len:1074 (+),score=140.72 TRINITY_DN25011_c0_g1_i1:91-3312(+)